VSEVTKDYRLTKVSVTVKTCRHCHIEKPAAEFFLARKRRDGIGPYCKECSIELCLRWKRTHRKNGNDAIKKYRKRRPEVFTKCRLLYRERHPARLKATQILNDAVQAGLIAKPNSCSSCGQVFPGSYIHGHHTDYGKPLQVTWLCCACHVALHQETARVRKENK